MPSTNIYWAPTACQALCNVLRSMVNKGAPFLPPQHTPCLEGRLVTRQTIPPGVIRAARESPEPGRAGMWAGFLQERLEDGLGQKVSGKGWQVGG